MYFRIVKNGTIKLVHYNQIFILSEFIITRLHCMFLTESKFDRLNFFMKEYIVLIAQSE